MPTFVARSSPERRAPFRPATTCRSFRRPPHPAKAWPRRWSVFYTRSRAYIGRYKMVVVMRGAGIGILTLLAVNYLFFRTNLVPRLALLFFAVLTWVTSTCVAILAPFSSRH